MASLKQTKNKIRVSERTYKVTKAIAAVSAAKMRKTQEQALRGRPYATAALRILSRASGSFDGSRHPLVAARPVRKACFVVITSDRGLAGNLNSGVIKKTAAAAAALGLERGALSFVTFGKKASEYFKKRGYAVLAREENVSDLVSVSTVEAAATRVIAGFAAGEYDAVWVSYPNFISTFRQEAVVRQMLPLLPAELEATVRGITPERGKYSSAGAAETMPGDANYTIEPEENTVLDALFPRLATIVLYHAVLEAKASEHSARMVAMKNASDKAAEMKRDFTLAYNHARQAAITREVSEITSGIEALR